MIILQGNHHTYVAFVAMEIVLTKALSYSTNATLVAVVNGFLSMVVPKFASVAVITGDCFLTISAYLCSRLNLRAEHAKHIFGFTSGDRNLSFVNHMINQAFMSKLLPYLTRLWSSTSS
jgi:hypothetical protein